MSKDPKYLVKFTNAQNDNGTVWYTIDVDYCLFRYFRPKTIFVGLTKKGSVICANYMSIAKRPNIKINCQYFLPENCSGVQMKLLSRKERNNWRITTILCWRVSVSMNYQIFYISWTPTNPKSTPVPIRDLAVRILILPKRQFRINLEIKINRPKRYLKRSWERHLRRWSKATSTILKFKTKPGESSTKSSRSSNSIWDLLFSTRWSSLRETNKTTLIFGALSSRSSIKTKLKN